MSSEPLKKRDAESTKAAILDAARIAFSQKGFDGAGLRDIAASAGVNAALINRYFGSKVRLFEEAVLPSITIEQLIAGEKQSFGLRSAEYFATKSYGVDELDPMLALLRSIGNSVITPILGEAIESQLVTPLANWIGGDHARERATLIVTHMAGFDFSRRVAKMDSLNKTDMSVHVAYFAQAIQRYVDCEEALT